MTVPVLSDLGLNRFGPYHIPSGTIFTVPTDSVVLFDGNIDTDDTTGVVLDIAGQLTDFKPPSVTVAPPVKAVPGTVLLGGDSIGSICGSDWPIYTGLQPTNLQNRTDVKQGLLTTAVAFNLGSSWIGWAQALSGGRFRLTANASISGSSTRQQLVAMTDPTSSGYVVGITPQPGIVIWQGAGGDDGGVFSVEETIRNLTAIYTILLNTFPNSLVCICTQTPLSPNDDPTRRPVNRFIRAFAQANNIILIDFEKIMMNGANGQVNASYSGDAIHPNSTGSYYLGREVLSAIGPYLPQTNQMVNDYFADPSVSVANGGWSTDALMNGTLGAGVTATGWTIAAPTGTTLALLARDDSYGNWQRISLPRDSNQVVTPTQIAVYKGLGAFPLGAVIYLECDVRVPFADWTGTTDFSLSISTNLGGACNSSFLTSVGQTPAIYPYTTPFPGERFVMRTPPIVIPSGVTSGFAVMGLTALTGTFDTGRFSLIRVA